MIPLSRPYFDASEVDGVRQVLQSGWVSQGPTSIKFEQEFARRMDMPHAVSASSCTTALHLALAALGVGLGDEVLVPDFTFPASANAVLYVGAKPVFVDIDPQTYNLDPSLLASLIGPKTKAMLAVHTFGNPADMLAVIKIAREHGIPLVEDAACAHGAVLDGRPVGSFGDVSCFSFHARKVMTTGEGGMLLARDAQVADRARRLATHGIAPAWTREKSASFAPPSFEQLGYNFRLSDIAAAIGLAQLDKLDAMVRRRRALAAHYDARLASLDGVVPQKSMPSAQSAYQSYVVRLPAGVRRDKVIDCMREAGIQTTLGTYACHVQPVYGSTQSCPVSRQVFEHSLALPLYHELSESQADLVVDALADSIRRCSS